MGAVGGFADHYMSRSLTRGFRDRAAAPPLGNSVEGAGKLWSFDVLAFSH